MEVITKICTKCKQLKSASEFQKDKSTKSGLCSHCKNCRAESSSQWYQNNLARVSQYREENVEKHKEANANWYKNNREKCVEHNRQWKKDNREKCKETKEQWHKDNFEKCREYNKQYRKDYPEREQHWRENNREKCNNKNGKRRAFIRNSIVENVDLLQLYENHKWICGICGKKIDKKLKWPNLMCVSHDHIIPISKGGSHTYDNIQSSHFGCNISKGAKIDNIQLRLQTA